jgi:hypothetical protein
MSKIGHAITNNLLGASGHRVLAERGLTCEGGRVFDAG